jgi:hypothetical protein
MRHFELVLWKSGVRDIAGVDEVGIGPLAGPVVAAAVVFPPQTDIAGVDDSKRLDAATRAHLALTIRARASGIGSVRLRSRKSTASTSPCRTVAMRRGRGIAAVSAARAGGRTHGSRVEVRRIGSTKATASILRSPLRC